MSEDEYTAGFSVSTERLFYLKTDCRDKDNKDECLLHDAVKYDDFEMCNSIESKSFKVACEAIRKKDISVCLNSSEQNDICFFEYAKSFDRADYCENIQYPMFRDKCIAIIAFNRV